METHPSHWCRRPVPIAACLAVIAAVGCTAPDPGPNEVAVRGTDYAFDVPQSLPPGPTAFAFENAGNAARDDSRQAQGRRDVAAGARGRQFGRRPGGVH